MWTLLHFKFYHAVKFLRMFQSVLVCDSNHKTYDSNQAYQILYDLSLANSPIGFHSILWIKFEPLHSNHKQSDTNKKPNFTIWFEWK